MNAIEIVKLQKTVETFKAVKAIEAEVVENQYEELKKFMERYFELTTNFMDLYKTGIPTDQFYFYKYRENLGYLGKEIAMEKIFTNGDEQEKFNNLHNIITKYLIETVALYTNNNPGANNNPVKENKNNNQTENNETIVEEIPARRCMCRFYR